MRSQISFEFIMIFTLVMMAVMSFTYIIHQSIADIDEQREEIQANNLANNVVSEIALAKSVSNNYLRRFDIPYRINSKKYNISIVSDDELVIDVFDEVSSSQYVRYLPHSVQGDFIERITVNTTDHCITKNSDGDIRISRNQVVLTPLTDEVSPGDTFQVLVELYCLNNIVSFSVAIRYDEDKFEDPQVIAVTDVNGNYEDPLFEDYDPSLYSSDSGGTTTFTGFGTSCGIGSGSIALLEFEVKNPLDPGLFGPAIIDISPDVEEPIKLWDCSFSPLTEERLPDSKDVAEIIIN